MRKKRFSESCKPKVANFVNLSRNSAFFVSESLFSKLNATSIFRYFLAQKANFCASRTPENFTKYLESYSVFCFSTLVSYILRRPEKGISYNSSVFYKTQQSCMGVQKDHQGCSQSVQIKNRIFFRFLWFIFLNFRATQLKN